MRRSQSHGFYNFNPTDFAISTLQISQFQPYEFHNFNPRDLQRPRPLGDVLVEIDDLVLVLLVHEF